jgi:hypothetical protein
MSHRRKLVVPVEDLMRFPFLKRQDRAMLHLQRDRPRSNRSRFHTLKEACVIERLVPERLGQSLTCARPMDNGPSELARLFFQEVAWLILYCARRTRPF